MSASSNYILYGYFRSSAVFRVRIALNLKGIDPKMHFVHLRQGQQHSDDYKRLNPQQLIPALGHDGHVLGQSLAIVEYLDETVPTPPLLPADPAARAHVRALALAVACDIHPLNNMRVLQYLKGTFQQDEGARLSWQRHWIATGFDALEAMLVRDSRTGRFCHGDTPTMADICLIPQLANARRAEMDLSAWPTLLRIEAAANELPAFVKARPENQPDAA